MAVPDSFPLACPRMHCENCGAEVSKGARYCAGCGAPLGVKRPSRSVDWRERLAVLAGRTRRERLLAAGTVLFIVLAVAAFALLDTPNDGIPRDAFTLTAEKQCLQAKRVVEKQRQATATAPQNGAARSFTDAVLSAVTDWRIALDGLQVPADRAREVKALDDSLLELIIRLGALSEAEDQGQGANVPTLTAAAEESTAGVEAAVKNLGLTDCAAVSLGA
jgi:hypothetical protein